jgi:hypothetical protein
LSGPIEQLPVGEQEHAVLSLLELRDDIGLPDPRRTVPVMAEIAARHTRLNVLNLEATASARLLRATVWLSEASCAGILPGVLDDEGVAWTTIAID